MPRIIEDITVLTPARLELHDGRSELVLIDFYGATAFRFDGTPVPELSEGVRQFVERQRSHMARYSRVPGEVVQAAAETTGILERKAEDVRSKT
jgi:hypothetical protein